MSDSDKQGAALISLLLAAVIVVIGFFAFLFWVGPQYNVYNQRMNGQAAFQKAEGDRQIAVLEAQAELEASQLKAQKQVALAKGDAESISIIGKELDAHPEYLKYMYIQGLNEAGNTGEKIIYVPIGSDGLPTLPVTEAGRAVK